MFKFFSFKKQILFWNAIVKILKCIRRACYSVQTTEMFLDGADALTLNAILLVWSGTTTGILPKW